MHHAVARTRRAAVVPLLLALALLASLAGTAPAAAAGRAPETHRTTGRDAARFDISGTAKGRQVADDATARWADMYDVGADPASLTVYQFTDSDLLVLPRGLQLNAVESSIDADGGVTLSTSVSLDAAALARAQGSGKAGHGASWQLRGSSCFARLENNTGWIDHCFQLHRLDPARDGSGSYDYWQLKHYATCKSKSVWLMKSCTLKSNRKSGTPAMSWMDWSPRADIDKGNCGSVTIGVTVNGFGISSTHNICDKWDITKHSTAGSFDNVWRGSARMSEREVAYMQAVRVAQGASPSWDLHKTFYAI